MRKITRILLIVILIPLFTPLLPQKALAGDLGVTIRINRLAVSKATSGMICATPESTGVENSVQVIFPTGFTVNSTASNWTVTTTNLPSGSSALPGIGTATAVSGQTVTFPSNDLVAGTEYCFNFSSSNTLTTPSSTGTYNGILRTMNSSNQAIDYHSYAISISTNDSISVTASVAANPTDFSANLALSSPSNGTFAQGAVLTYTLTYGSLLSYNSNITVEAGWDLGTIQGSGTPTEDILDYVIGSTTNGYNNTPPIIDTVNRKIDWNISPIPGNTSGQTVTFQLITNSSYTGSLPVTFTVNGRVLGPSTQTPDSTVTSTFQNVPAATATPAPIQNGGNSRSDGLSDGRTDGRSDGKGPLNTPIFPLKFIDIEVRTISSSQAAIFISASAPTKLKIAYGTSLDALNQTVFTNVLSKQHLITLSNLKPHTRYYFKVTANDQNGSSITSDLYLLDTARVSDPPLANTDSLIVTSRDVLLIDTLRSKNQIGKFVIPSTATFSFKFEIHDFSNVKQIRAIIRNKKVLGVNNFGSGTQNTESVNVTEIIPGHYVGKLDADIPNGEYELILQVQDYNGNISEQKVAEIFIVSPMRIVNAITKNAIENAKITFYFYNQRLKIYELLSSAITPIKNPGYSEPNGEVPTILPEGKYRVVVENLGFKSSSVDFNISSSKKSFYPTISLSPLPFNFLTLAKYYGTTAVDYFRSFEQSLQALRTSFRFFDLVSFLLVTFLVFLLTVALSKRLSVPIFLFPSFALYHVFRPFRKNLQIFLVHGNIATSGSDEPIAGALLYFSTGSGKVIGHAKSNIYGEFFIKIHEAKDLRVIVSKKGFKGTSLRIKKDQLNDRLLLQIDQTGKPPNQSLNKIRWYIEYLLSTFFEAILIIVLCIELVFIGQFGILKVMPFLIVSIMDIILWAENIRAARR